MSTPASYIVGQLDDGTPLYKDESSRKYEKWLNHIETAAQCNELRTLVMESKTLAQARKEFYGRALYIAARFSLGLTFSNGVYADPNQ